MRTALFAATLLLLASNVAAQELPDLVCQTIESILIRHNDVLSDVRINRRTVYRIEDGNLYLVQTNQPEYFYNDITFLGSDDFGFGAYTYRSGYKTIVFDGNYERAVDIHTDALETVVSRLHCLRI